MKKINTETNIVSGWLYKIMDLDDLVNSKNKKDCFDPVTYSRFKYGDGLVGKIYGYKLAEYFIKTNPAIFSAPEKDLGLVITTCPYKNIQRGSTSIVKSFKEYLNAYLFSIGKDPAVDFIVIKESMFEGDYGNFSEKDRVSMLKKSSMYAPDSYLVGKTLIAIDDVRITGSHEKSYTEFFSTKSLKSIHFLYVAVLDAEYAKKNPNIEHNINHYWVNEDNGFERLIPILNSPHFALNARVCKFILSPKNYHLLPELCAAISDDVLVSFYVAIVSDGYADMTLYKDSFVYLRKEMEKRRLLVGGTSLSIPKI